MRVFRYATAIGCLLVLVLNQGSAEAQGARAGARLPRTMDGKPDLQGIWQASNGAAYDLQKHGARPGMPAGDGVVVGGSIPYQPAAAAKKAQNFTNRQTADPLLKCYMPGVPRIMYLDSAFQIFQTPTHIAETFAWSHLHRLIYVNGSKPFSGIDFWMGDSRGHWEGDTLVVEVTNHNDRTWFDMAGDFHSDALRVVERYTLLDANTIQYEATIEDPNVFTRPWTIRMPFHRQTQLQRLPESDCAPALEERNGTFTRDTRTWPPVR